MVVPSDEPQFRQVEMFLYLADVQSELGPPAFVPRQVTANLPVLPNWLPRADTTTPEDPPGWVARSGSPALYDVEVLAMGPPGTVVAYRTDTFHRGTELTHPRGARYTIHM